MRLIDADEFIKELSQLYAYAGWDKRDIHFSLSDVACNLEMMPVIRVVTPKHGHWIVNDNHHTCRCSCCENMELIDWALEQAKYCPNCGAKMAEVEK